MMLHNLGQRWHTISIDNAGFAAAAATLGRTSLGKKGLEVRGQLQSLTNILASRLEDLNFPDEETDSEESLDYG